MKILNVTTCIDFETGGGSAERTFQMSRHLVKKGHDVTVLSIDIGLIPYKYKSYNENGINLFLLSSINHRFLIPIFNPFTLNKLIKHSEIIHLMNHWSILNVIVFIFAFLNNKPYVVCPAGSLYIFGRSKILKIIFNHLIGRKIIQSADFSIACAKNELRYFYESEVPKNKIKVIPNGININDYQLNPNISPYTSFNIPKKPFILFVGRLNKIKGPDMLLAAYARIANSFNYNLVFAGRDEGILLDLKLFAKKNNLQERVFFVGHVSGKLKVSLFNKCKFVVISSHSEPLPIVLLEAGASKKPILITDKCGFNQIEKIKAGLIVKPNILSISKGMLSMAKRISKEKNMGVNLFTYVSKNYAWERIIDHYIRIYLSLARKK